MTYPQQKRLASRLNVWSLVFVWFAPAFGLRAGAKWASIDPCSMIIANATLRTTSFLHSKQCKCREGHMVMGDGEKCSEFRFGRYFSFALGRNAGCECTPKGDALCRSLACDENNACRCTRGRKVKGKDTSVEVEGKWEPLYTLWGETTLSVTHGTETTRSETESKEWSETVSASISAEGGISVLGLGVELSTEVSRTMASELTKELSETEESTVERVFSPSDKSAFLWQWVYEITTTKNGVVEETKTKTQDFALTSYKGSLPKCLPGYCEGGDSCDSCNPGGWLSSNTSNENSGMATLNCERGLCPNNKYQLDLHYEYAQLGGTLSECEDACLKSSSCSGIEWRTEGDSASHCKFWLQNACTEPRPNQTTEIDSTFDDAWTCDKETYSYGQPNTLKCPAGFRHVVSLEECKTAATAVNITFGKDWGHGGIDARPSGCYRDSQTSSFWFNNAVIGSPHQSSSLVCALEDISVRSVRGRWHRLDSGKVHPYGGDTPRTGKFSIFVETYIGARKTRTMTSATWAQAAKAAAGAGLLLGGTGTKSKLDTRQSRAVANMFEDDWERNELTQITTAYEIPATEELVEAIVNGTVNVKTFWQWVFEVETYGAETVTLYTGNFVRTLGSFESPRCIPGSTYKKGGKKDRCVDGNEEESAPYPRDINDQVISISGAWVQRQTTAVSENEQMTLRLGNDNKSRLTDYVNYFTDNSLHEALEQRISAGVHVSGGTANATNMPDVRQKFLAEFEPDSPGSDGNITVELLPGGWLWQWVFITHVDGTVVTTATSHLARTSGAWQHPRCLPGRSSPGRGNQSYQQCGADGALPGVQPSYAYFADGDCGGPPHAFAPLLSSQELAAEGQTHSLATCTRQTGGDWNGCTHVKVECVPEVGKKAKISWWTDSDCSTPCSGWAPDVFTAEQYSNFSNGQCVTGFSYSFMGNAMDDSLPHC